jgi:hypothetical protein
MHCRKLNNSDWKMIEDRIEKKLNSWKGKHMSFGGWLVLINSVITSLTMLMLPFLRYQKVYMEKLSTIDQGFFWQSDSRKKKYRLTK